MEYLKNLPCASAQRINQGSETLDDLIVKEIEKEVDKVKEKNARKKKTVKMQVRPHLLYRVIFNFYKYFFLKNTSKNKAMECGNRHSYC